MTGGVFNLWGRPPAPNLETIADSKAKQEAEKKINELGLGECVFCKEDIVKNDRGIWESESLVEYCHVTKDHKHKPRIVYKDDNE